MTKKNNNTAIASRAVSHLGFEFLEQGFPPVTCFVFRHPVSDDIVVLFAERPSRVLARSCSGWAGGFLLRADTVRLLVFASTVSHRLGDKLPGGAPWRDVLAGVIGDQEIGVFLKSNYAATMVLLVRSVSH